jgi:hypothetical protein
MANWSCEYTKTLNGRCEQQKSAVSNFCYYHHKVMSEYIEADEEMSLREMPTLSRTN